mmetsp:Transcript_102693/g.329168  ORF Transcript_102693/g.329168 Transcript_102693/m.329168 type:complete len:274 (-) Transcript_102693:59-880(-)
MESGIGWTDSSTATSQDWDVQEDGFGGDLGRVPAVGGPHGAAFGFGGLGGGVEEDGFGGDLGRVPAVGGPPEQPSVLEALAAESRTQGRSDRERSFSQSLVCRTSAWPQRSRQSGLGLSSGHSREHPTRSCLRFARCEDTTTPSRSLGSQPSTHDLAQPYGISAMELLYKLSPKLASAKQKVVWQSRRQRACDSSSLPAALICKAKCSTRSRNRCRGRTTDSVAHSRAVVAKQGEGSECMAGSCVCRRLRQVERSTRKHVGGSVDLHVVSTDI